LNNTKKILKLVVRFLFYGNFAAWSFVAVSIIRTGNSGNFLQDSEAYLIPSEYNPSLFSGKEDAGHKLHFPGGYLNTSRLNLFRLNGNNHDIKSGKLYAANNIYIIREFTRPPPVLFSFFT
jgi:hypothetical protein